MDWTDLDQDREKWWVLVNTFGFQKMWKISWLAEGWLAVEEGLYSMELVVAW